MVALLLSCAAYALELPSINRSKIRLNLVPGKAEYGEILIENQSSQPRSMKVYLSDWNYLPASDGTKEFFPPNTTPLSAASWISFSPAEFTMPPFSNQKINYSVKVPQNVSGGYYAALFFESVFGKVEGGQADFKAGMNLAIRIATLFYIDVQGTVKRQAFINNLALTFDKSAKVYAIDADFRNTGNVDITLSGTYHIMDDQGMVLARGEFNDIYTFPGGTGKLKATNKTPLAKGNYTLVLTINLGKALEEANVGRGPIMTKEANIEIGEDGDLVNVGSLQ